jgi:hypothetical protein
MVVLLTQLKYLELNYFMLHKFTYNEIEYTITGPIEVISDTQLHVETDKGIILVDDTMDIYKELVFK